MNTAAPIEEACKVFEEKLNELEQLLLARINMLTFHYTALKKFCRRYEVFSLLSKSRRYNNVMTNL